MRPPPDAPPDADRGAPSELIRFDAGERTVHWTTAALTLVSFATAAALFIGPVAAAVGRRDDVRWVHVTAGLLLPVPFAVGLLLAFTRGGLLRSDLRRLDRWSEAERRWLRMEPDAGVRLDKFNPGQKLNAAFTAGAILLLLASGAVMHWFGHFPLAWRAGASVVHDLTAAALTVTLAGHVLMALTHPASLRSMLGGRVSEAWARREAPRWLDEERGPGGGTVTPDALRRGRP
ncbi:MAG TPA: cytochrome b/b6 domain-containing protein [Acidimicrobiales bacterium]|nr:cytochrome b/b6 domain-containing protein [Acidimicrobiales bacterium]